MHRFLILGILSGTLIAQSGIGGSAGFGGAAGIQGNGTTPITPATYYVATNGNDTTGTGSYTAPFATINKAALSLRSLPCTSAHTVLLLGGTYYGTSWTPTSADAPGTGCPVTYANYPMQTPILSGGLLLPSGSIPSWTQVTTGTCGPAHALSNLCWQTTIPNTSNYPERLYYNGQPRFRPRIYATAAALQGAGTGTGPGYAHVSCAGAAGTNCATTLSNNFTYSSADSTAIATVDTSSINAGHVEITAFNKWTASIQLVATITTGTRTITTTCTTAANCPEFNASDGPGPVYGNGYRFIVENYKAGLKFPGQWYIDTTTGGGNWTISYVANSGENPNTDTVVIGQNVEMINTTVTSGTYSLQNTTFSGIQFEHDNYTLPATGYASRQLDPNLTSALVQCNACKNVTFTGAVFAHTTATALQFTGASTLNTVTNSAFYDIGAYPVQLGLAASASGCAPSCTDSTVPNHKTVTQSFFEYNDRFFPSADGIMLGLTNNNTVSFNDIGYAYDKGVELCEPSCTSGSTSPHDNTITNMNIHNIAQGVMTDLAGVYIASATATGNILENSLIHDVTGSAVNGDTLDAGVHGAYLDGTTGNVTVQNNVIYRVIGNLVHMNQGPQASGQQNTITNNILVNTANVPSGNGACVGIQKPDASVKSYVYSHNICSQNLAASNLVNWGTGPPSSGSTAQQQFISNVYSFSGSTPRFNVNGVGSGVAFSAWQATYGEDTAGSISANPGFVAPNACTNTIPTPTCDNFTFTNGTGPGFGFVYSAQQYGPTLTIAVPVIPPTFPEATLPVSQF